MPRGRPQRLARGVPGGVFRSCTLFLRPRGRSKTGFWRSFSHLPAFSPPTGLEQDWLLAELFSLARFFSAHWTGARLTPGGAFLTCPLFLRPKDWRKTGSWRSFSHLPAFSPPAGPDKRCYRRVSFLVSSPGCSRNGKTARTSVRATVSSHPARTHGSRTVQPVLVIKF